MRATPLTLFAIVLGAVACGGTSKHDSTGGASSGATGGSAGAGASSGAGGACAEPASKVPEVPPFEPPLNTSLATFDVTFHNRCAQTVWPAWCSGNGLDNSEIDTALWFPLAPATDRTVTVYGGVRYIGFWGRTGCSFDEAGGGDCQTGDCGGFVCPIVVNAFPKDATAFVLQRGFLDAYNIGLRVAGEACGTHDCAADLRACSPGSAVEDACGNTIACGDTCSGPTACCSTTEAACAAEQFDDTPTADNLAVTFCP